MCDAPLVAPLKVHIASGDIASMEDLSDMKRTALETVLLIDTLHQVCSPFTDLADRVKLCVLHQELHGSMLPKAAGWKNAKLNSLLQLQLDDPMSVLTGTLPDWCFVLVRNAPCLFDVSLRKTLFELSAFGLSETVARVQSKYLADMETRYKKMLMSDDMEMMMKGIQLEEQMHYLSIGTKPLQPLCSALQLVLCMWLHSHIGLHSH